MSTTETRAAVFGNVEADPPLLDFALATFWRQVNMQLRSCALTVVESAEEETPTEVPSTGTAMNLWLLRVLRDPSSGDAQMVSAAHTALRVIAESRSGLSDQPSIPISTAHTEWMEQWRQLTMGKFAEIECAPDLRFVQPDEATKAIWLDAQRLLESAWPEAYGESKVAIREAVLVDGEGFSSGSTAGTFGAMFVNPELLTDVTSALEVLMHETAHHVLWMRESFGPFVLNPDSLAWSPLRKDPRPMTGVFHAAFVLVRICQAFERVMGRIGAQPRLREDIDDRITKLAATLEVLEAGASWSDCGERMLANMNAVVTRLRSRMESGWVPGS